MGKNKQFRFTQNATFDHVVQPGYQELREDRFPLKGRWKEIHFERDAPIVLELGCGKGEYTTGLARLDPSRNYIGVDIKGARIWRGARTAMEQGLTNVAFLRTHVDHITSCFSKDEVDAIWLTFSDPQLRKARKRLTSDLFLERYMAILRPGGSIHLKTDSPVLYEFTMEQVERHGLLLLEHSRDVYAELVPRVPEQIRDMLNIRTFYESMWLQEGRKIHFVQFELR
ncbi:MAG: tRNA (guanosine(46)-N7)-methyltransferase TrmB [Flavobacteriales bacterium]|nr:tRNA (guanosine(46)-N7)-methyltransferase TrmB [Flavobacteriales bacterium]